MLAAPFPGVYKLGLMTYIIQDLGIQMEVVHDNIRLLEASETFNGKQPDVTGACTYYVNFTFFHIARIRMLSIALIAPFS